MGGTQVSLDTNSLVISHPVIPFPWVSDSTFHCGVSGIKPRYPMAALSAGKERSSQEFWAGCADIYRQELLPRQPSLCLEDSSTRITCVILRIEQAAFPGPFDPYPARCAFRASPHPVTPQPDFNPSPKLCCKTQRMGQARGMTEHSLMLVCSSEVDFGS